MDARARRGGRQKSGSERDMRSSARRTLLLALALALLTGALAAGEAGPKESRRRFVPFARGEAGGGVKEGSIINVPTRCPPNMLKVGNRCRTVY